MKRICLTFILIGVYAAAGAAQTKADEAAAEARDQFNNIKNRSIEIERMRRDAFKRTVGENFALNFAEIKQDFERIQKLDDELLKLTAASANLDDAAALKIVSEIHRRAARLAANLFPTPPESNKKAKDKTTAQPPDTRKMFAALDDSINKFVHSPLFQNVNLVNAEDSLAAQQNLQTIISVSGALKTKIKD